MEENQKLLIKPDELNEEEATTENNNQNKVFEVVYNTRLKEGEKPLSKVIGHENQKAELLNVIKWFKNSKELKAKGVSIPRGCILFGDPGNGKSLMIKEIIKCCDAPVFVFQGEKDNAVVEGIIETFKKARKAGHAIIVFDELDLLINKERRVLRALQESLDGVESDDDILVLAATNDLEAIPDPLVRCGRLEKLIKVPYPTAKEAMELFKKHVNDYGITLPKDFDEDEVSLSLHGLNCSGIKAVVNDIVLRNGFENITSEMIDNSIYNITDRVKSTPQEDNIEVATHEAAHAVVAKQYPQFFDINRLNISGASGSFHAREVEKDFWPYDKVLADIRISMAGVIGQKVMFGRACRGCESDLQNARVSAYNLFNISGYSTCSETLPVVRAGSRTETQLKRRRMERKIERLLRKCEKETYKIVKANKEKIKTLANLLFEKKHLKSTEILSVIG
ncbi:MAG: AAA family ATPase [Bacilli bacterium]|nr:AAA family ATPase [Bacilli bacterium]